MRAKSLYAALTVTISIAACTPENGTSNSKPQSKSVIDEGSTGIRAGSSSDADAVAAPQAPNTTRDKAAAKALTQDEKSLLQSIDSRYFGTLTNSLPGENVDLNKLGFPDASSWIASTISTDDELLQNARKGGHLEKELFIDRVASLIPENNWRGVGSAAEDNALTTKIMDARSFALQNIGATKSPFAAYQAAALFNATEVGGNPAMIAASFQLAAELGDTRATRMLQGYMSGNRNIDVRGVLAAYTFLKSDLRDHRSN